MDKKYFIIDLEMLDGKAIIYPFHLYLYNNQNKNYTPFLHANSPFNRDKQEELLNYLEKGAKLAVAMGQKETFLNALGLSIEDVPSLNEKVHDLEKARLERLSAQKGETPEEFHIKEQVESSIESNDFSGLIAKMREEVLLFNINISNTVTLAIKLSEKLLIQDNLNNRIVAMAYFLAKACKISKEQDLGELICAAYLHQIGQTQIDTYFAQTPLMEYSDKLKKQFKKYPALTHHLLRKSKLEVDQRVFKIIIQHREKTDGTGFPDEMMGDHLDVLALVLSAANHIIEFSNGRIQSQKTNLKRVITNIKNQHNTSGLINDFGNLVNEGLASLIHDDDQAKAA